MARPSMSGSYREYIDSVMRHVKCDATTTLTDMWKTYVAEELSAGQ